MKKKNIHIFIFSFISLLLVFLLFYKNEINTLINFEKYSKQSKIAYDYCIKTELKSGIKDLEEKVIHKISEKVYYKSNHKINGNSYILYGFNQFDFNSYAGHLYLLFDSLTLKLAYKECYGLQEPKDFKDKQ